MDLAQVTFSCELKIIVKSEQAVHHSLCDPQFLRLKFNDISVKKENIGREKTGAQHWEWSGVKLFQQNLKKAVGLNVRRVLRSDRIRNFRGVVCVNRLREIVAFLISNSPLF